MQDGNGFKTSSMRLGGDVIVFSRCQGKDGLRYLYHASNFYLLVSYIVLFLTIDFSIGVIEVNVLFFMLCSTTQSVGMLSYTFLRNTGKEDIIVPMV